MTEAGRFADLQKQGFMKMGAKPRRMTAAEKKAKKELDAEYATSWTRFRAEEAARYDAWFTEDAAAQ